MLKIKLKGEGGLFPPPFSKGTGWAVITVLQFSSQTLLRPKSILAGHHLLICDTFYSKWNVILSLVNDCNKSMGKENRTTENSNSKFPPVVRAVLIAFVTFSKKKKKNKGGKKWSYSRTGCFLLKCLFLFQISLNYLLTASS